MKEQNEMERVEEINHILQRNINLPCGGGHQAEECLSCAEVWKQAQALTDAGYRKLEPLDEEKVAGFLFEQLWDEEWENAKGVKRAFHLKIAKAICERFEVEKADYVWEGKLEDGTFCKNTMRSELDSPQGLGSCLQCILEFLKGQGKQVEIRVKVK